mmetsp:Transcript_6590/g.19848  ORF Transcript_6590/g.19848 Transcript_6590/m.19848 type:complete len:245 (+) Transcript_6590:1296-2030(+)
MARSTRRRRVRLRHPKARVAILGFALSYALVPWPRPTRKHCSSGGCAYPNCRRHSCQPCAPSRGATPTLLKSLSLASYTRDSSFSSMRRCSRKLRMLRDAPPVARSPHRIAREPHKATSGRARRVPQWRRPLAPVMLVPLPSRRSKAVAASEAARRLPAGGQEIAAQAPLPPRCAASRASTLSGRVMRLRHALTLWVLRRFDLAQHRWRHSLNIHGSAVTVARTKARALPHAPAATRPSLRRLQ